MKRLFVCCAFLGVAIATQPAMARGGHHAHRHRIVSTRLHHRRLPLHRYADGRPRAWCGWYLRQVVGVDPGPAFNLARNWAHWGRNAGGPGPGVVVVWSHHVGRIVGQAADGGWIIKSGNDGNRVRTRERSLRGVIAFREE